jgi:hypothetical protein
MALLPDTGAIVATDILSGILRDVTFSFLLQDSNSNMAVSKV